MKYYLMNIMISSDRRRGWPVMRSTHLNLNKIMRVAVTVAIRRIPFTTGPEAPLQLSE